MYNPPIFLSLFVISAYLNIQNKPKFNPADTECKFKCNAYVAYCIQKLHLLVRAGCNVFKTVLSEELLFFPPLGVYRVVGFRPGGREEYPVTDRGRGGVDNCHCK